MPTGIGSVARAAAQARRGNISRKLRVELVLVLKRGDDRRQIKPDVLSNPARRVAPEATASCPAPVATWVWHWRWIWLY